MNAKITVAEAVQKTTKGGKPYLNIKSDTGKFSNIWSENQYLFHLFTPGASLEVEYTTDGKYTTIVGVVDVQKPSNDGGTVIATQGAPSAWDKVFERLDRIEKKLDSMAFAQGLVECPPLDGDIKVSEIPF